MDNVNQRILAELGHDGRIQYAELARRLRLAPNTVRDRVFSMRRKGIVKGFRAVVDARWYGEASALVYLKRAHLDPATPTADDEKHRQAILTSKEHARVLGAWSAAGEYQMVLLTSGRSHEAIHDFIRNHIQPLGYTGSRFVPLGQSVNAKAKTPHPAPVVTVTREVSQDHEEPLVALA